MTSMAETSMKMSSKNLLMGLGPLPPPDAAAVAAPAPAAAPATADVATPVAAAVAAPVAAVFDRLVVSLIIT